MLRSASLAPLAVALCVLGSCEKKGSTEPAGKAEVSAGPAAALASAPVAPRASTAEAAFGGRRPPRDPASLVAPPLTPPADARSAALGVRWQPLRAGSGPSTTAVTDTVVADYSVWTTDGKLAFSSYSLDRSAVFHMSRVGKAFHGLLAEIPAGGSARFWVPRAALQSWRPQAWPDADLVIDLEMISVHPNILAKPSEP